MEKSFLQQEAELSKFSIGGQADKTTTHKPSNLLHHDEIPVQPFTGYYYDPSNPNADWAGNVRHQAKKKHFSHPKTSLRHESVGGIVPNTTAALNESLYSGRRIYSKDIKHSSVDPDSRDSPLRTAVYQVGPGESLENPTNTWTTSSIAAKSNQEATKHSLPQTGKRQIQPQFEKPMYRGHKPRSQHATLPNNNNEEGRRYVAPPRTTSLLAGIGKSLASSGLTVPKPRPAAGTQKWRQNPTDKSLLADNYHQFSLGYTGLRRE